ncbi:MAG: GtrA family protein [Novosphingobium sp.]
MKRSILLLAGLRDVVLMRYLVASMLSLGVDMGSFTLLLALGTVAAPAAAAGYALGIVAHWLLSSRKVFTGNMARPGPARMRQKAMFVISALIGLALTTAIVGGGTLAGIEPHLAKLAAIVASFSVTWLLRSRLVFTAAPA